MEVGPIVPDGAVRHLATKKEHRRKRAVLWLSRRRHQRRVRRDEPDRRQDKIGFVQARHEEMAAFMATAYAKFSGQAKNFSLALMKGDPNESGMIKGTARQVLESILPGKQ
ncbi:hypothetical protein JQ588_22370 [Bradyrhizobium liaoningense]|nr:hypothetical protein [Bradyrhizobium liaoningense]